MSILLYFFCIIGFPIGGRLFFLENLYLLMIRIFGLGVYFLLYGGYHSGSRYSLIGGYRSVRQLISYEIILIFLFVSFFYLIFGWNLNFKFYEFIEFNFFFCIFFVLI